MAPRSVPAADPLARFSPPVATWFRDAFAAPTPAQVDGWAAIAAGGHVLLHAPTGSGKTLAAFLWCLDRLVREPARPAATAATAPGSVRILYVSPLKALTYDVERNLRAPLAGIALAGARLGIPVRAVSIASRTGDTTTDERRSIAKRPPEILITTPESLYLLLTSQAREILRGVEHVIIDEVHAVAGTKRGAHLALSLERLEALRAPGAPALQRIGLSATQRPLETIGRFLAGTGEGRAVTLVDPGTRKALDLQVVVPVEDMRRLGEALPPEDQPGGPVGGGERRVSIWPAIHPRILELIRSHRSTLVFVNSRRLAERLAQRLNELAGEDLVRAHHGSIAREQRVAIEEALKDGRLPALVATSSLELGIDMGAIDLVIQVESPTSVARGLQRVGRAGHRVDEVSRGVIFPKYRGDLLECAVVAERMREGLIEATTIPRNPLDVLAQQIVAMTVMDRWSVDDLLATVTRAAPFETLTREVLEGVLAMLAGAYPSDEFAELKPRVVWDRVTDTVEGRRDARVVAVTSGGTIPDRGLFGVFVAGEAGTPGRRVGELDEEMVYELRAGMHGDVIVLGASSWRVLEITPERVIVAPAPGEPGKLPFWKGDAMGRPIELGRALGALVRDVEGDLARGAAGRDAVLTRLRDRHHLDALAAENLVAYLEDEKEAAGALPTDRRVVVERFRDELGDWRLVLLTPFGGRVHAPWSLAIEARLRERLGQEVASIWSDDGIAIRLPEGDLDGVEEALFPDPEAIEDLVVAAVGSSALFAARFRENAGRALLLPRRRPAPGRRSGSSASVRRTCSAWPAATGASRSSSRPTANASPTSSTCRRCARSSGVSPGARSASTAWRRLLPRRWRRRSSSTTSPPSCTRATRRSLSAAPRRSRWTATCSASCWARRSSASCWTRPRSTRPSWACRRSSTSERPAPWTRSRTCSADWAICPGTRSRPGRGAARRRRASGWRRSARRAARSSCGSAASPAGSRSRTPAATGTRRAPSRRRARRSRSSARRRTRWGACSLAGPAPTARSSPSSPRIAGDCPRASSRRRSSASRTPGPCSLASSGRVGRSANGATRRCSGSSGAGRSRGCGGKWSRSRRPRSRGSCPPGRASSRCRRPGPSTRLPSADRPPSSGSPRSSISWRASRSPPPSWSATCSRRGSRATSRGSSTSWAPSARSPGSGAGRSAATTAAWRSSGPAGGTSCERPWQRRGPASPIRPTGLATPRSATCSPAGALRSIARSSPPPAVASTARSSMRCGTWCGPAR